jgi:hypothetical protein
MEMYRPAHRGILICALLLLAACGGKGKTSTTDVLVGGLWTGTLTVNGVDYTASAISSESGEWELLETDPASSFGAQYWGMISAAGDQLSGSFSGAVLDQANTYSDGSTRGTGTVSGTINERSSITATMTFTTSLGTAITGQLALTYDPGYEQASSLTTIAGNYTNTASPGTDVLTIDDAGLLSYTDPLTTQCTATGTVTVLDSSYSVYGAEMTFSNCTGAYAVLNGVSIQGLANLDTSASAKSLQFMMHGMENGLDSPVFLTFQGT